MLVSTLLRVQYRIFKEGGLVTFLFDTGFLTGEVAQVEDAGAAHGTEFADSEYARRCLHLVDDAMATGGHDEDCQYIDMILSALDAADMLTPGGAVGRGGLFCSLLRFAAPLGYDILSPREVRLDAFLFGEEDGRYLVAVDEGHDDQFLLKMDEARLNCCFLGRTTKGRILVDGYDFGPVSRYTSR